MALPSLAFLLECTTAQLQELELASLNRSANLLRQAKLSWDEAIAEREIAGVARWLIENREVLLEQARKTVEVQSALVFPKAKSA